MCEPLWDGRFDDAVGWERQISLLLGSKRSDVDEVLPILYEASKIEVYMTNNRLVTMFLCRVDFKVDICSR